MKDSQAAARVRVFQAGEFAAPKSWPEDVGVAVVMTGMGNPELFPVHRRESGVQLLRRIEALSGIALGDAAVQPAVPGHPDCDLSYSTVRELLSGVEDLLARTPEAVEEAEDFAINFEFAAEEGIPLAGITEGPTPPETATASTLPEPEGRPHGYAPVTASDPVGAWVRKAVLRIDATGERALVLDPDGPVRTWLSPEVLVRDDGLGIALARSVLEGTAGAGCGIRLSRHVLAVPGLEGAQDVALAVGQTHDYLLFTPVAFRPPLPVLRAEPRGGEPVGVAGPAVPAAQVRRSSRAVLATLLAGLVLGLGAAYLGAGPPVESRAVTPVEGLRADLFR